MMAESKPRVDIYYLDDKEQRVILKGIIIHELPLNIITRQGQLRLSPPLVSTNVRRGDREQTIPDPDGGSYTVRDSVEIRVATVSGDESKKQDFYIATNESPLRHRQYDVILRHDLYAADDSSQVAIIRVEKQSKEEEQRDRQEQERREAEERRREEQVRRERQEKYRDQERRRKDPPP